LKILVLVVLLIVLPLQTLWAAGAGHCLDHQGTTEHPSGLNEEGAAEAHTHVHDGNAEGAGHATDSTVDCSAFHFIALEASSAAMNALPRAGTSPFEALNTSFKSHIPKGPYRPRWRFAV
jgi:hypothetical protein